MNRRTRLLLMAVLLLAVTALAVAQMGAGMGRNYGMGPGWGSGAHGHDYMASSLNLTDEQKQKAESIFDSAYKQAQTLREQMYEKRKASWNSKKPMTDAEIDKLAAERGEIFSKMQATREKAFANFYNNVLTTEQRTQYDKLRTSAGPRSQMGWRGRGSCRGGQGF